MDWWIGGLGHSQDPINPPTHQLTVARFSPYLRRMTSASKIYAGLVLSLVATSAVAAQCPDGTPPPCDSRRSAAMTLIPRAAVVPSLAERGRRFLVLPFRNVTRQADQDWLVEGSTTMLAEALGRWKGISVVPDEKLYPALKRAGITPGTVADEDRVRRV
jgi:hypothetical protein